MIRSEHFYTWIAFLCHHVRYTSYFKLAKMVVFHSPCIYITIKHNEMMYDLLNCAITGD